MGVLSPCSFEHRYSVLLSFVEHPNYESKMENQIASLTTLYGDVDGIER